MADWVDLVAQFLVVAFGALAGSTFMWLFLGPIVAKRGMNRFMSEAYDLSEEEIANPKDMMKAITKKQGETFASSIYGALGNVIQSAPTDELAKIAGQNPELVQQFLGSGGNGGGPNALSLLGSIGGDSKTKNPFGGIVQLMLALQAMGAMGGGNGGAGIGSMFGGGGGGGSYRPGIGR